ncbi:hypothetical protein ACSBR1_021807 [Camellia fascicularis]
MERREGPSASAVGRAPLLRRRTSDRCSTTAIASGPAKPLPFVAAPLSSAEPLPFLLPPPPPHPPSFLLFSPCDFAPSSPPPPPSSPPSFSSPSLLLKLDSSQFRARQFELRSSSV